VRLRSVRAMSTPSLPELHKRILESSVCTNSFHFLKWHFTAAGGEPVPFGVTVLQALAEIESHVSGYAQRTIDALASLPDREKNRDDYDQIVQRLAEVLVVRRLVLWGAEKGATFEDEPVAPGSAKNPELLLKCATGSLAVEVKTAKLGDHASLRASQSFQLAARVMPAEQVAGLEASLGSITKPRDNPIKDFLRSANEKFEAFKTADPSTVTVLVIVWDDHAFEVTTTLLHEQIGLLTENSWLRQGDEPEIFPHIDAVVVTGHQLLLHTALAENPPFTLGFRGLDWEHPGQWFGVVAIDNPAGAGLPPHFASAFAPRPLGPGETQIDMVIWTSRSPDSPLNQTD
jgi:hypothetical protein